MKTESKSSHDVSIMLILTAVGVIWLRSALGKVMSGTFVQDLGKTLNRFADMNPYPWFKEILVTQAVPNAEMLGMVVMGGELLVAGLVVLGSLYLLFMRENRSTMSLLLACGLLGGLFLNLLFWLAAGHTSASTDSLNLLMMVVSIAGLLHLSRSEML